MKNNKNCQEGFNENIKQPIAWRAPVFRGVEKLSEIGSETELYEGPLQRLITRHGGLRFTCGERKIW